MNLSEKSLIQNYRAAVGIKKQYYPITDPDINFVYQNEEKMRRIIKSIMFITF